MSMGNIIVQRNAAYLMSDGAFWNWGDGTLAALGTKIVTIPRLRMAFAIRGHGRLDGTWRGWQAFSAQADVLNYLQGTALPKLHEWNRQERPGATFGMGVELTIVWHDAERDVFQSAAMHTAEVGSEDVADFLYGDLPEYAPYRWMPMARFCLRPGGGTALELCGRRVDDRDDLEALDVPAIAKRIAEAQRRRLHAVNYIDRPIRLVGGFCDLATVSRSGVTIQRVVTWPDQIGRRAGDSVNRGSSAPRLAVEHGGKPGKRHPREEAHQHDDQLNVGKHQRRAPKRDAKGQKGKKGHHDPHGA